jgi:transposase
MRFEEIQKDWTIGRLTQAEAAKILGVSDRTFRRYLCRYEQEGMEGLTDHRIEQTSHLKAPVDEVVRLQDLYREKHLGWNVKHFYSVYKKTGERSYNWVRNQLQACQLVEKLPSKGKHRKRRERSPIEGMMIHQDGSTHLWVPGVYWDLIVTMDDATNEHYSMFFVPQEGTVSSMKGVQDVIELKGLFCSFYSDRGSHYWNTPEAGGKVDKINLTQFGYALKKLGINMIAAYSPEARGRSERMFKTHQDRLVKELAYEGITDMEVANQYLKNHYMPAFNKEFSVISPAQGSAFVPHLGSDLKDILCEQFERTVGKDNCISFESLSLQIPQDTYKMHYVKAKVRVHRYSDKQLAIFHGPRKLADYDKSGVCVQSRRMSEPRLTQQEVSRATPSTPFAQVA